MIRIRKYDAGSNTEQRWCLTMMVWCMSWSMPVGCTSGVRDWLSLKVAVNECDVLVCLLCRWSMWMWSVSTDTTAGTATLDTYKRYHTSCPMSWESGMSTIGDQSLLQSMVPTQSQACMRSDDCFIYFSLIFDWSYNIAFVSVLQVVQICILLFPWQF